MKRLYNIIVMLIILISVLCGCSSETDNNTVPSDENKTQSSANNFSENKYGEEFLLSLVDCDDAYISRHYEGYKDHKGIDIVSPEGRNIYAAEDGIVSRAVEMSLGYGYHIIIDHKEYRTLYAHCSELLVKEGENVKQGDIIALSGNTGNSTGPHLHFEVIDLKTKERINPLDKF